MQDKENGLLPRTYQIKITGNLDQRWSEWLDGLKITSHDVSQITTLHGQISDQAKLRGILNKLWDLNLEILSVNQMEG